MLSDIFIHRHLRRFLSNYLAISAVASYVSAWLAPRIHVVEERVTLPPFPAWARVEAIGGDPGEAAFLAGAALAILNARVRADAVFAGVWRQRLALKAAAASTRIARRGEHEAMLRDAFYLRHGGADPGPAGRILLAWRSLDRSAPLDDDAVVHVAELFGLRVDDALTTAIAGVRDLAASDRGAPFAAAEAARIVLAQRPDAELLALWVADAVLAARLKWPRPLALLADALLHRSLRDRRAKTPSR